MDRLNRKRCTRNPILIERTKQTYQTQGMQYAPKLKAYPSNPAYDCVFNPLCENVYDKQPNTIQPFGLRVKSHFENSDINLDDSPKTAVDATLSPSFESSVYIVEYSDLTDLISAKCC
jgi:hypothetical protein